MNFRLKELRLRQGWSQEEFRQTFNEQYDHNYTAAAISMFGNNKRLPTIPALFDFADFFSVSLDYILGRENVISKDGGKLSPLEKLHLKKYRALSTAGKSIVDATMEAVCQQENPLQVNTYEKRATS